MSDDGTVGRLRELRPDGGGIKGHGQDERIVKLRADDRSAAAGAVAEALLAAVEASLRGRAALRAVAAALLRVGGRAGEELPG